MVAREIGTVIMVTCASSDYLQACGAPITLQDLVCHRCVSFLSGPATGRCLGTFRWTARVVLMRLMVVSLWMSQMPTFKAVLQASALFKRKRLGITPCVTLPSYAATAS